MTVAEVTDDEEQLERTSPVNNFALVVITVIDVGIIFAWLLGVMQTPQAVMTHTLTVFSIMLTQMLLGPDKFQYLAIGVLYALVGPLGCPALLIARCLPGLSQPLDLAPRNVARQNVSMPDTISNAIRQRRRYHPRTSRPVNYLRAFKTGSSKDQQAVIAAISRKFEPEMRPALDLALKSTKPELRVSAAAVFAKLRSNYSRRATDVFLALQNTPRGSVAAELAAEARIVAKSGFLPEDQRRHLIAAAGVLDRRARPRVVQSDQPSNEPTEPIVSGLKRQPDIKRYSCGGMA